MGRRGYFSPNLTIRVSKMPAKPPKSPKVTVKSFPVARPVEVKWIDIEAYCDGWKSKDDKLLISWIKEECILCVSVGYLVYESDNHVVLAQTLCDNALGEFIKIPRSVIKSLEFLSPSK